MNNFKEFKRHVVDVNTFFKNRISTCSTRVVCQCIIDFKSSVYASKEKYNILINVPIVSLSFSSFKQILFSK